MIKLKKANQNYINNTDDHWSSANFILNINFFDIIKGGHQSSLVLLFYSYEFFCFAFAAGNCHYIVLDLVINADRLSVGRFTDE